MIRIRFVIGVGAAALVVGGAAMAACGGNDVTLCGGGTTNVGGVCVVDANDGETLDVAIGPDGELDAAPPIDAGLTDGGFIADAGDASVPPNRCPFGKGPVMAEVPNLYWDAGTFCIDTTEVSEAHYNQFLTAIGGGTGDAGVQPSYCPQINFDYTPGMPNVDFGPYVYDPNKNPNLPVRGVDWCDAYAYCKWAGKRLCDRYDKSSPAVADAGNWKVYETSIACSQNKGQKYAYGSVPQQGLCPALPINDAAATPVGTSQCKGTVPPYSEVYDTSGSVSEWFAACSPAGCTAGGAAQCDLISVDRYAGEHSAGRGIRCCAD